MTNMAQPPIRTKRAALISLAICLLALVVFVLLLAFVDTGRQLWTWGALLALICASFSTITTVRARE